MADTFLYLTTYVPSLVKIGKGSINQVIDEKIKIDRLMKK